MLRLENISVIQSTVVPNFLHSPEQQRPCATSTGSVVSTIKAWQVPPNGRTPVGHGDDSIPARIVDFSLAAAGVNK